MSMYVDFMRRQEKAFPNLERSQDVTSMRIWHCKFKSLLPLESFENLEELVIATFPDENFDMFKTLRKLRFLSVMHMPKVSEISPLESLGQLESLSLSTSPSWDSAKKCLILESLEPLARIPNLKHLELFGVCESGKSMDALLRCKKLQSARFSQYPKDSVENFFKITKVKNTFNPKPSFL